MFKRFISLVTATAITMSLVTVPTYSARAADEASEPPIKIGDYVQMGSYDTDGDGYAEPILWRCVAFEKVSGKNKKGNPIIDSTDAITEYQDGYLPLMLADISICKKMFDAEGEDNLYSHGLHIDRPIYGSNYWGDSNIRDWLNSNSKNVDYSCGNNPPYAKEAGFLTHFTALEKAAVKAVSQKSLLTQPDYEVANTNNRSGSDIHRSVSQIDEVVQNYSTAYSEQVVDSMFLLDVQQLYNVYSNDDYFGKEKYYKLSSVYYWLRSPYAFDCFSALYASERVYEDIVGYNAYGVRPAFFLDLSSADFISGTGAKKEPYYLDDRAKGDGTKGRPYLISTAEELAALSKEVRIGDNKEGEYYKLAADIDLGGESSPWTPIGGVYGTRFNGNFDGGYRTIRGLYINEEGSNYQGLFGYLGSSGTIKNVTVEGTVIGGSYVGGVCGYNYGGTISHCHNIAAVKGTKNDVGGICGSVKRSGVITECYNSGAITGSGKNVGGIIGLNNSSTVMKCYNAGTADGNENTGGVCGYGVGTITDCYNTGSVTGNENVGGVCGLGSYSIINCYNTGTADGSSNVGAVCGYNDNSTIKSCYYLDSCGAGSGTNDSASVSITADDFAKASEETFTGWDFNGTWRLDNALNKPILKVIPEAGGEEITYGEADADKNITAVYGTAKDWDLSQYAVISIGSAADEFTYSFDSAIPEGISINGNILNIGKKTEVGRYEFDIKISKKYIADSSFKVTLILKVMPNFTGGGTQDDPYIISDLKTFELFRNSVNNGISYGGEFLQLGADIDMSRKYGASTLNGEVSWTPIGVSQRMPFEGSFDGGGHKISSLYINNTEGYQGLFGLIKGGSVSNFSIDGKVTGGSYVGSICGASLSGTIANCRNNCYIIGEENVGSLCGAISGGSIANSVSAGLVTGSNNVGGICGANFLGTIINCRNDCELTGNTNVGGICGTVSEGSISNSIGIGNVKGSNYVGRICGYNENGSFTNCYFLKLFTTKKKFGPIGVNEDDEAENDAAEDDAAANCEGKDYDPFTSGEVAYLLQKGQNGEAWGQDLSADKYPVPSGDESKTVYKISIYEEQRKQKTLLVNPGKLSTKLTQYIVLGLGYLYKDESCTEKWNYNVDVVSGDMSLYAKHSDTKNLRNMKLYRVGTGTLAFDPDDGTISKALGVFLSTVEIPEKINGKKVVGIYEDAFEDCEIMKGVILPDTIEFIGERAFKNSKIQSINIPSSVRSIGDEAFAESALGEVSFSSGVETIGDKAFYATKLKSVVLPDSVKNIGSSAFEKVNSLKTAVLYGNIGNNAFADNSALTSAEIKGNCTSIGKQAFYNCRSLYNIELPADLSVVGEEAFSQTPIEQGESSTVGSLNIYGGNIGTDYTYSESDNTLTILSSKNMVIENNNGEEISLFSVDEVASGQAVNALAFSGNDEVASGQAVNAIAFADDYYDNVLNTRIVIAEGVDAVLTLDGVDIDGNGEAVNALSLESGSSLDLMLMGDNTLTGGSSSVGINVPNSAELTVDGSGSLTLSGGSGAADINGSAIINGGAITANGDIFGFEENVILNGGIITFSDEYVYLNDDFDGVVYVGEIGEVHGDVVISQNTTLPEDTNLYIPADEATLTIADGAFITIPSTSNLTITYGGKEITITPINGEDCVMGTCGENGLDLYNGTIVIEGDSDVWLTCITVPDGGGILIFNEDGSISVPPETYAEINLDDGITVGQYGGIIRPDGTVTDNVSILFDSQGGSFIFIQPLPMGDKITKPQDPTYDGYIFGGWYKEAECINAWDFENDTADESMTLYAKWTKPTDDNTGDNPNDDNPNDDNPDKDNADDKSDDSSSSGKISRGGGGGRSSSAAVKKTAAETEIIDEDKPTETDETDETKEPVSTTKQFTDVKDGIWYTDAVNYAVENGLFFGTSDTLFSPNARMTRGMIATVLYRADGEPKTSTSVFTDVVSGEWYSDAVNWAAENNIVSGYGNGLFKPNNNITREQLAAILYRYAGSPTTSNTALTFADTDKVSDYATDALLWATENSIIYGKDNNILDPQGEATRAEVAAMLMRYFNNVK